MAIINGEGILRRAEAIKKENEEILERQRKVIQTCLDSINGYRDKLVDISDTVKKCRMLVVPIDDVYDDIYLFINTVRMDGFKATGFDENEIYYNFEENTLGFKEGICSISIDTKDVVSYDKIKIDNIYEFIFMTKDKKMIRRIEAIKLFLKKLEGERRQRSCKQTI